ncbi:MAG: hypothetical protein Q9166_006800 [cf. Caloplaca sp. 2 TL-2023]
MLQIPRGISHSEEQQTIRNTHWGESSYKRRKRKDILQQNTRSLSDKSAIASADASGRYLIADYERSSFSISQCCFLENSPTDIRPILPPNSTNGTNTTTSTDSHHKGGNGVSRGIIIAIVLGSLAFLAILVSSLWNMRRRKKTKDIQSSSRSSQIPIEPETIACEPEEEQELHADEITPPELHGISNPPLEMENGVAAVEMSAQERGIYELNG